MTSVLVIGGGVGALVASDLAAQGFQVTLVDERSRILAGASGRHGRRLHLGEHYSGDPHFAPDRLNTGQTCLLGALSLVERWPDVAGGDRRWWQFVVAGSMTPPDAYHAYLAGLRAFHAELRRDGLAPDAAFGPPGERHRTIDGNEYAGLVDARIVETAVESREPVIDAPLLHDAVVDALRAADVEVLLRHRVVSIAGEEGAFTVVVDTTDGERELSPAYVVNAAWHGLAEIATALTGAPLETTARLRVMAEVELPPALADAPSMYFHRGVFGSHTNIGRGRALLLAEDVCNLATDPGPVLPAAWRTFIADGADDDAWVPLFRQLADHPRVAPAARRLATAKAADPAALQERLADEIRASYHRWVPDIAQAPVRRFIPNIVISAGDVNLSDPESAVHRRDAIVREPCPGYVEALTGKLTYFVLVAEEVTARLVARARGVALADARRTTMAPVVLRAWQHGAAS